MIARQTQSQTVVVSPESKLDVPPPVPDDASENADFRLWIGNLDTRLTEYSLLKILQKFGELKKFDFLYHKSGPDQGKPRGYCFVTYESHKDAQNAMIKMNGKLALSKRLIVRWANKELEDKPVKKEMPGNIQTLSPESKIKAIEEKLQKMQQTSSEFSLVTGPAALPGSSHLSIVQRESRQKQQEMLVKQHSKKPYKR